MSVLSLNRLCRDIERNLTLRQAFLLNPKIELSKYPHNFTFSEREALLLGNASRLLELGINSKLLGNLCRHGIFGLNPDEYARSMRLMAPFTVVSLLV